LNPDPSQFKGGMNLYAYGNGNAAGLIDPSGTDASSTSTAKNTLPLQNGNTSFIWGTPSDPSDPFGVNAAQAALDTEENDWMGNFATDAMNVLANVNNALYPPASVEAQKPQWAQAFDQFEQFVTAVGIPELDGLGAADATLATSGAENSVNGVLLNQQLSAQSAFNASGELSQEAIAGSEELPITLGNPAIPSGLSKFSTSTFDSPSGPFQVHFYMNPTTSEIWAGLDYKTVFNNPF
jgi:hypothetical protein